MTTQTVIGSVESIPTKDGILLFLPLCPSTNARMGVVRMGGQCRQLLTKDARDYIAEISEELQLWVNLEKFKPITYFTYLDLWFILPRTNCDAHNYGKVLFDAMEQGGIVTNDKFILPRIQGVAYDPKMEPLIILKLPDHRKKMK